jgi:hypothetical protein
MYNIKKTHLFFQPLVFNNSFTTGINMIFMNIEGHHITVTVNQTLDYVGLCNLEDASEQARIAALFKYLSMIPSDLNSSSAERVIRSFCVT